MSKLEDRIEGDIKSVTGLRGTVVPTLKIEIELRPKRNNKPQIDDISASVQFNFEDGSHIDGPQVHVERHRIPNLRSKTTVPLKLEFSPHALERLEKQRAGQDIGLEVDLDLWGKASSNSDDTERGSLKLLESPYHDQWTEILDALGYHNVQSFEIDLDLSNIQIRDQLSTAVSQLESAERSHDRDNFPAAAQSCRRAVETLMPIIDELEGVMDKRKRDDVEELRQRFEKGFLGALNHSEEMTSIEPPLRRDTEFALTVAKGLIRYVATIVEDEIGETEKFGF